MLSVTASLLSWAVMSLSCYFSGPLFTHLIKKWHLRYLPTLTNSNSSFCSFYIISFVYSLQCWTVYIGVYVLKCTAMYIMDFLCPERLKAHKSFILLHSTQPLGWGRGPQPLGCRPIRVWAC